ncbi:MAG: hypothetical protein Q9162_002890 [Coniocarpon cinnabarinum]
MPTSVPSATESLRPLDISFLAITPIFFALRCYSRFMYKQARPGWDDLFVVASFLASIAICVLSLVIAHFEKRYNPQANDQYTHSHEQIHDQLQPILICIFTTAHFLYMGCAAPKLSLIALYLRIFPGLTFKRVCKVTASVLIIAWFGFSMGTIFFCQPIHFFWDRLIPGRCFDEDSFFRAFNIFNVVEDAFVLILPLKTISTLQMPTSKKLGTACIFLLSAVGTGISIARAVVFFRNTSEIIEPRLSAAELPLVVSEPCVYCIACCAGGCAPLFRAWKNVAIEQYHSIKSRASAYTRQKSFDLVTSML